MSISSAEYHCTLLSISMTLVLAGRVSLDRSRKIISLSMRIMDSSRLVPRCAVLSRMPISVMSSTMVQQIGEGSATVWTQQHSGLSLWKISKKTDMGNGKDYLRESNTNFVPVLNFCHSVGIPLKIILQCQNTIFSHTSWRVNQGHSISGWRIILSEEWVNIEIEKSNDSQKNTNVISSFILNKQNMYIILSDEKKNWKTGTG